MKSFTYSKKLILTCLVSILASTAFCQWPWDTSFPDSNAIWLNGRYTDEGELWETDNYCLTSSDTVINELNYKTLEQCNIDYQGALRTDSAGNRVYLVPRDSVQEYLIYDFTANLGDTLHDVYFQSGPGQEADKFTATVVVTDSSSTLGSPFQSLAVKIIDNKLFEGFFGVWAIGVGETDGFLRPPGFYWESLPGSYGFENLACHSHLDTVRYSYPIDLLGTTNGCALDMSVGKGSEISHLQIYPNPVSDQLNCVLPKPLEIDEILIVNSLGKTVKTIRGISQNEITIDLSDLPPGVFFLRARAKDQFMSQRFVKR